MFAREKVQMFVLINIHKSGVSSAQGSIGMVNYSLKPQMSGLQSKICHSTLEIVESHAEVCDKNTTRNVTTCQRKIFDEKYKVNVILKIIMNFHPQCGRQIKKMVGFSGQHSCVRVLPLSHRNSHLEPNTTDDLSVENLIQLRI